MSVRRKFMYLEGTDLLGSMQPSDPSKDPAILIRVRDIPILAKSKGGAAGGLAARFLPETIKTKVYSDMKEQFDSKLKEQGVDADVTIVSAAGFAPVVLGGSLKGIVIGAGTVGAGLALWKYVIRGLLKR